MMTGESVESHTREQCCNGTVRNIPRHVNLTVTRQPVLPRTFERSYTRIALLIQDVLLAEWWPIWPFLTMLQSARMMWEPFCNGMNSNSDDIF